MPERLKVLMSAYACEPGKGSEPEVGWRWALGLARFHDLLVLTRSNNESAIREGVEALPAGTPVPRFLYHDLPEAFLRAKRMFGAVSPYYVLWQRSARKVVARLHASEKFDLAHHVTIAGYRYPVATSGHGIPCIWGPIGGIESIPRSLLPWHHGRSLGYECFRRLNNLMQGPPLNLLRRRAAAQSRVLASTHEMQAALERVGVGSLVMPTIGLSFDDTPRGKRSVGSGGLRLLFAGQISTLKGADLALDAMAESKTNATLTFIGSGDYAEGARRRARVLGIADKVIFAGRLPRAEMLKAYSQYDVFLFPSVHDTGSFAVLEALYNELPVICLDVGGPAVAVDQGCGCKIPITTRGAVIRGLAEAIRSYADNPVAIREAGAKARLQVRNRYDWRSKAEAMNAIYWDAVRTRPR